MKLLLAVAAGGAVGAVARYLVTSWVGHTVGHGFPWGTLAVNVAGSFALGVLIEVMALKWSVGPEFRAFMVVGVLGAFTTFSTFSLDVVALAERGASAATVAYVAASVLLSVGALFGAMRLFRAVLA